ncbi:TPA: phage regulatory CII family protein [Stenotrophomonas maltophilia]|uniref:phage regulatory CII family protein n=1 Tax=Stenotrophomonas sp. GD03680 TaxID=2975365 RepID=UPI0018D374ED|nr:phage regulatory CII family protein [Stenotrophomonas sp. GD03680]MBH1591943.1 phage regulatory CII family protein [Stenotrophomonas maltophilia]MDH2022525.1 phage regulatory CII family protein [Stenotrophomonas sp. GD03680]HEL3748648.1 phage regulatory CII family protein [Stenotrophomonas maltophilia]HEL7729602.1 phage regulatory CII family protein [Stenotrophomonas maltophilia]
MNVLDAAYDTVHDYPGGAGPLAERLTRLNKDGERVPMSEAVLNSKVNPNTTSHHLTLAEADRLMGLTGDYRILHALAGTHGFVVQRVEAPETGSIIHALLVAAAAKGDLAETIAQVMADNRITGNESGRVSRDVMRVIAALVQVSQHAEAAAERGGA